MDGKDSLDNKSDVFSEELSKIPEATWENMGWPIISQIPTSVYQKLVESSRGNQQIFWKEVLKPANFFAGEWKDTEIPQTIFIIHTPDQRNPTMFKAITTQKGQLIEDPTNMLNYIHHGLPCEQRGNGEYPTCDNFWTFYDQLSPQEQDKYPIPDKGFRKNFVKTHILNSDV